MNTAPKFLFVLTGVAALSLAYPASVQAVPITYTYTGNHFTEVTAPYTTDMFVTVMVTLAEALPPNAMVAVTPTAFTFFDGVQTITNFSPIVGAHFFFNTNPRGEIAFWSVFAADETGAIGTNNHPRVDFDTEDFAGNAPLPGPLMAFNFGMQGVWRPGSATPDTGSTLSLMTLTLIALVLVARRLQRATA